MDIDFSSSDESSDDELSPKKPATESTSRASAARSRDNVVAARPSMKAMKLPFSFSDDDKRRRGGRPDRQEEGE